MISNGYLVEDRNRFGHSRSRLLTTDPWIALADWLMRSHKPLGFPPGTVPGQGGLSLEVLPLRMPAKEPLMDLEAIFVYQETTVRTIVLSSPKSAETEFGFLSPTAHIYLTREYREMLHKTKERLERFCAGDLQVAFILAVFASRSPTHPFWNVPVAMRARGLSM